MKRILVSFVILLAVLVFVGQAQARPLMSGDPGVRIVKFYEGRNYYTVQDGSGPVTRVEMDAAPYMAFVNGDKTKGRLMLPLRYVGNAFGIPDDCVKWLPDSTVTDPPTSKQVKADVVRLYRAWAPVDTSLPGGLGTSDYSDVFEVWIGQKYIISNGLIYGSMDVVPEIRDGRTYIPMRFAAQGLGGMCFWDGKERSATLITWSSTPAPIDRPNPMIKTVTMTKNSTSVKITYDNGTTKTVKTSSPVCLTDPNGGWMLNAVEWFKLWGVPEDKIIYDPVRGGMVVRGRGSRMPYLACASYLYLYKGEKQSWDNFGFKNPKDNELQSDNYVTMFIKNEQLFGDVAVSRGIGQIYGGLSSIDYRGTTVLSNFK